MSTAEIFLVLTQFGIFIVLFSAFALEPQFAFPLNLSYGQQNPSNRQRPSVSGWIENNDGRLRLVLTNNSTQEFRGATIIALGSNNELKELGQVELALPPQEISLLQITGVTPSSDQYSLAIYDQRGVRVFFKIAPVRRVSDSTPAVAVTLTPVKLQKPKAGASFVVTGNGSSSAAPMENAPDEFARVASQVQVQARLLANEDASDTFILSFELRAQRPVYNATLAITSGKMNDRKQVSINLQSHTEFKLPSQLDSENIGYTLTGKDGKVLAQGELDISQLMADDSVTVNDIRTDRSAYNPGETARITLLLEGRAKNGYRLDVSVRDGQNQSIFHDQKIAGSGENSNSIEFVITIPNNFVAPVVFEFKILDSGTGLLFDSGEREIQISGTKPPPSD